jgi:hypothetical protein
VLLLLCALVGCAAEPKAPPEVGGLVRRRNEGYSLIYKLMSDESDVDKLLIIKRADASVAGLIKEIANAARGAKKQMDEFASSDKQLDYQMPDLPRVEQDARDLTAKAEAKTLLTSSGSAFQLRLLYTQAQAMGYGEQLAKATLAYEDNADRKKFLADLSQKCGDYHRRLMEHLATKP